MSTTQQPFTIWTERALQHLRLATSTEYDTTFGIYLCSEIHFRFHADWIYLHTDKGADIKAIMERRGN